MKLRIQSLGFTLIEVMIAVAIIAILASVAVPGYNSYLVRTKLTEAQSQLGDIRVKMEQFYQDNRAYGTTGTTCGVAMPTTASYFSFACVTANTMQTYTVTATSRAGVGLGNSAGGYAFTINETNTKTTTAFKAASQSGKNCWLWRGSEC